MSPELRCWQEGERTPCATVPQRDLAVTIGHVLASMVRFALESARSV